MEKSYYPVNLDLEGKRCVVIGGGLVSERKVKALLQFGAKVSLIAPALTPALARLVKSHKIKLSKRKYRRGDLKGAVLAIAATDDQPTNKKIYHEGLKRNVLVNIVDRPQLCSFIAPSFIKRGPLVVTISTSGQAPLLAKTLRRKLEKLIPSELGLLTRELGKIRRKHLELASARA